MRSKFEVLLPEQNVFHRWTFDKFMYRPDRPWWSRWIQKACFRVLKKLEAYAHSTDAEMKFWRETVDYIDLADAIMKQRYAIEKLTYNRTGRGAIVVGQDVMHQLKMSTDNYWAFRYPDEQLFRSNPPEVAQTFMGLTVVFCPWLDGMAVLPDVRVVQGL